MCENYMDNYIFLERILIKIYWEGGREEGGEREGELLNFSI